MLLILVFLVAIQSILALWSQVGGQYHLDLMYWPWKLGLTLTAAALVTAIGAEAGRTTRLFTRRTLLYFSCLIGVMLIAGVVTFYYHQNEPAEEDSDEGTTYTTRLSTRPGRLSPEPSADSLCRKMPAETPAYSKSLRWP